MAKKLRQEPSERVITIGYISLVRMEDYIPSPSYFADRVIWEDVQEIPLLAFDHNDIVENGLKFLRHELNHEVTSELLRKFTLSQLQELHEIVLDQKFDKEILENKRLIMGLKVTNEKQKGVSHKPARHNKFKDLN